MAEKKEDRRIRRTKKLLRQALAELMDEKEFKDITVKEIAERADLNRGTFYFHYTDTYDLKDKIENELVDGFINHLKQYRPTVDDHSVMGIVREILNYIEENRYLVSILFNDHSGDGLRPKMTAAIERVIVQIQKTYIKDETAVERRYISRFLASGIVGSVSAWLEHDHTGHGEPMEEMAQIMNDLITRIYPVA